MAILLEESEKPTKNINNGVLHKIVLQQTRTKHLLLLATKSALSAPLDFALAETYAMAGVSVLKSLARRLSAMTWVTL